MILTRKHIFVTAAEVEDNLTQIVSYVHTEISQQWINLFPKNLGNDFEYVVVLQRKNPL